MWKCNAWKINGIDNFWFSWTHFSCWKIKFNNISPCVFVFRHIQFSIWRGREDNGSELAVGRKDQSMLARLQWPQWFVVLYWISCLKNYISQFFYFPFAPRYFSFSAIWLSKEEELVAKDVHGQARVWISNKCKRKIWESRHFLDDLTLLFAT